MKKLLAEIFSEHEATIREQWAFQLSKKYEKVDAGYNHVLFELLKEIFDLPDSEEPLRHAETFLSPIDPLDEGEISSFLEDLIIGKVIFFNSLKLTTLPLAVLEAQMRFSNQFDMFLFQLWNRLHNRQAEQLSRKRIIFEQAADFLKTTINFTDIGLFILDTALRIVYWGDGMKRLYNIEESEVLEHFVLEKFPSLEKEGVHKKFIDAIEKNKSSDLTGIPHKTWRKGKRLIDFKISPLRDSNDRTIGVNVLVHDVTQREKEKKALIQYEQFISNILKDAAEAIFVLDKNDCVTLWNKQAAKMYGYNSEEIIGKPISLIVPNDEKSQQEIERINKLVKEKGFVRDFETERVTRDGRKMLLQITRTAIRNEKGEYLGSSVIARDITETRRLEQQLIQSEKLSAVGQLAAGIAHEVGSPLTAISSLAQLLYEQSSDESNRDKLKLIREQIDRIARIVRELVNFSKPITTTVGNVSVNAVIEEAVRIVKYDKRLKYIKTATELFPALPSIKISFDQLLQVLVNILLNAGDALEGKKNGTITINSRLVGEKIIITIMDNGIGIEPENLDKIFEPFFTTKKPGKGTGLGLWVCYNIVKGFSGDLLVESEQGKGTAFHVVLPILTNLDEKTDE
ncbi:MAG: PAS domain-containing sensor histidine kinase [Candidatus Zhuqueibacterota bacterium]